MIQEIVLQAIRALQLVCFVGKTMINLRHVPTAGRAAEREDEARTDRRNSIVLRTNAPTESGFSPK